MEIIYNQREKMSDFIRDNKQNFQDKLLSEAVNVASKITDILETGNIDLLKNAQRLALYVVEQKEEQLIAFAQQEGVAWAEYALTLAFKLEWVQAIRRTLWHFLYQYDRINNQFNSREEFYALEKRIKVLVQKFQDNCK
jgi:rsbT co-antagonist protein RsbR